MELNADFEKRAVIHTATLEWQPSPMAGVHRRMLDRIGDEVARATTIVRYQPGSHFSPHVHSGGEEFVVLDGVFQDEHGDYPVGSYVRNPPQSRHTPGSEPGCVIFVKLWQFDPQDRTEVRTQSLDIVEVGDPSRPGVQISPLFEDHREVVQIERYQPNADVVLDTTGGAELLVLEGELSSNGEQLVKHSWMRVPAGERCLVRIGSSGARVWLKRGHLRFVARPSIATGPSIKR